MIPAYSIIRLPIQLIPFPCAASPTTPHPCAPRVAPYRDIKSPDLPDSFPVRIPIDFFQALVHCLVHPMGTINTRTRDRKAREISFSDYATRIDTHIGNAFHDPLHRRIIYGYLLLLSDHALAPLLKIN